MTLEGKNVLVTGANRGIGRAFTDVLLDRGVARVYAAARRPETMTGVDDRVVPVRLDLTEPESIANLVVAAPDVDLLISNAAGTLAGPPLGLDDDDVRALFETNVFGLLDLFRRFAPILSARSGGAVLVSSVAALMLSRGAPVYSASKAAATMTVLGIGAELRASGVQVSVVYPGFVDTEMTTEMDIVKAPAALVARRSLERFEAGEIAIFPDRYAEIVEETLRTEFAAIMRDPHAAATAAVKRYRQDPRAGD